MCGRGGEKIVLLPLLTLMKTGILDVEPYAKEFICISLFLVLKFSLLKAEENCILLFIFRKETRLDKLFQQIS